MKLLTLLLALALAMALALSACTQRKDAEGTKAVPADAAHNSRNALDWAGTYEGTLPCADCPGIQTRLTLNRDESFALSSLYVDRDKTPRVARGRFGWQPNGNVIVLDAAGGGQQFAVAEGRIALLEAGALPVWPQSPQRVLKRVAALAEPGVLRALESHRWTLAAATMANGQPIPGLPVGGGREIVFHFADGRLSVEGGCNRSFGSYQIDADGRLKVGRMASTMMACEPAAMLADAALAELLEPPAKIELTAGAAPMLRLVAASQAALSFNGQLTPEARYGPPTRVFLEVAAQTVACSNPLSGAKTCLQVRERRYDDKGLVIGEPGAWQPFYETIEGYTHQPGTRNVLRLKRFDRGAAAGAPAHVYVLDLVVESATQPR